MSQDYVFSQSATAPCALIGLNGHDLCHLGPLPTPVGTEIRAQLNPGFLVHAWAMLYGYRSSAQLQPCLYTCWSRPQLTDSLPSLTLDLSHHQGPAWRSVGCVWSWLLSLALIPTCGLTSQLELRSAFSPRTHLMIRTLGWTSLRSAHWPCWALAGEAPALPAVLRHSAHGYPSLREQPALAAPWHSHLMQDFAAFCHVRFGMSHLML